MRVLRVQMSYNYRLKDSSIIFTIFHAEKKPLLKEETFRTVSELKFKLKMRFYLHTV